MRLLGFLASILLLVYLIIPLGFRPWEKPLALRYGQEITAEVTGKRIHRGRRRHNRPHATEYITYQYQTASGRTVWREESAVSRKMYDRLEVGSPVTVMAWLLGPVHAASLQRDAWDYGMPTVSVIYWLVCARQVYWLWRWRVRRGLLTHGEAVVGRVVDVNRTLLERIRGKADVVRYEYDTPAGVRTGRCLLFDTPVRIGEDTVVFYCPRRPRRSVAYLAADHTVLPVAPPSGLHAARATR